MKDRDLQIPRPNMTLRAQVEQKLREAIAGGVFKPGQRLVERNLCEMLGVGRTSVREALRRLEAEGLVMTLPHRGPIVTTISLAEAEQLYALRALLESFAGQRCAEFADEAIKAELEAAAYAIEQAAEQYDAGVMIDAKAKFYDLLLKGGGNVFVEHISSSLHNRITMLRLTSMTQPGRLEQSIQEIREIVAAIRAGDAVRAGDACRVHVEAAAKTTLEYLAKNYRID